MPAILPSLSIDSDPTLAKYFTPYQVNWIQAEDALHAQDKQVFALAEKSVRIGWTHADSFKNVRKRLRHKDRDYLFATKDYPSALEYMRHAHKFAEFFDFTRAIVAHGEDYMKVNRLDEQGRATGFTDEIKIGFIKFDNGSSIRAFSAHPQAMAVYGGDVGLDEFAKHPNARLLWETAQGRITWGFDMAVWSAHDGQDTLFYEFAQEARAQCAPLSHSGAGVPACVPLLSLAHPMGEGRLARHSLGDGGGEGPQSATPCGAGVPACESNPQSEIPNPKSQIQNPKSPWNLYYRVTMPDAVEMGLLEVINRVRKTRLTPKRFLADCKARARLEEIYQQTYLCNPAPGAAAIVDWSAIEHCRFDYPIERLHLEADQIRANFFPLIPDRHWDREQGIERVLSQSFTKLVSGPRADYGLGFDVAASGQGDLTVLYIEELQRPNAWLRALFTCRTDDWHFIKTVLFYFMRMLPSMPAAGDETGLGRQICWEASKHFGSRFLPVNFSSHKHDLGFGLMNQLSVGEKRFPRSEQDIAADYFALRKKFQGTRWIFCEGANTVNPASHCDIAWAGALATRANTLSRGIGATVG